MSILDNLPHKCMIRKKVKTKGALGGQKSGTPLVTSRNVLCWEQAVSDSEKQQYEKRNINDVRKVYFTSDPQVTEHSEILITERNGVVQGSPPALMCCLCLVRMLPSGWLCSGE